ncbi:MAG: AI-2E family transporter [Microthrixaceae bacterium]|jgi:predicted PurR-regulated permease PerM|nr:AI-2E family transporter [Actinomycetota bacterium]HMS14182.1 AI-2E family transporter [Microthrixaceae bacterium]HMT23630.1 AI-2E family transporter [Microthrixaceae bacterium]HMT61267.1 AI-2E family transporter [Microthrixaceae bacterium]
MTTPDGPVPGWLRTASDWSWRLIVIVVASWMVVVAAIELGLIVGPVLVAAMICALLEPIRRRLLRRGLSANASWIVAFVIGFACVSGVLALVVSEFYDSYDELAAQARDGVSEVTDWLETGPLKVDATGVDSAMDRALNSLRDDPAEALAGTFSVLSTTTGLLAGGLLTFVTTLFFMKDRAVMWGAVLRMTPAPQRDRVDRAGRAAWHALIAYVKVTLTSAVVDSLAIGIASAIAGLPVAFALGALVFLFAFIPTVGAIVSGSVVVLVALVSRGPTVAVVIAGVVLVVQQLDANVMYPWLTSRQLSIHPLASLLLVAAGGVLGGIFGAFIAVPIAATVMAAFGQLRSDDTDGISLR